MTRTVPVAELDRALAGGLVKLGRVNRRPVRCVLCSMRRTRGHAWKIKIEGRTRGFICEGCWPPGSLNGNRGGGGF